jgi:hypothetical protein
MPLRAVSFYLPISRLRLLDGLFAEKSPCLGAFFRFPKVFIHPMLENDARKFYICALKMMIAEQRMKQ